MKTNLTHMEGQRSDEKSWIKGEGGECYTISSMVSIQSSKKQAQAMPSFRNVKCLFEVGFE